MNCKCLRLQPKVFMKNFKFENMNAFIMNKMNLYKEKKGPGILLQN